jgi:hypothetical protein
MLGALDVLILFSEDRFRRKEKLDRRAAAAWKSPFNAGVAEGSGEPSLVKVLEGILEGVVLAILIQRDAPVISMSSGLLACACNLGCRERRAAAEQLGTLSSSRNGGLEEIAVMSD